MVDEAEQVDVLVFSPHPDDAEVGCGGFLLMASAQGLRTAIADLSEGEKSTRGNPATRRAEKAEAARRLGLTARIDVGLPDTLIGQTSDQALKLVSVIRRLRPGLILQPVDQDRHPDHEAAAELVKRAVFLAGVAKAGEGAPHRVEQVLCYSIHQPAMPDIVFDISSVWQEHVCVLECYKSQFGDDAIADGSTDTRLSGGGFLSFLEARARFYGAMIGARYGEAYWSQGPVPLNNPKVLFEGMSGRNGYKLFP